MGRGPSATRGEGLGGLYNSADGAFLIDEASLDAVIISGAAGPGLRDIFGDSDEL